MKVALLTDGISPIVTGGMQKHSFYLAKFLAKRGVEVDLYHCVKDDEPYDLKTLFTEDELPFISEIAVPFPKKGYLPFQYIRNSFRYSVDLLLKFEKRDVPDFIYAQGFTAWAFFKEKKKGNIKAPIGVNFHGLEMFQLAEGWKSKLTQYMFRDPVKYNLKNADFNYSLGGKLTDILKEHSADASIREIPIGLEDSWVRESDLVGRNDKDKTKMVFVGRYERRKGTEELYQVIDQLKDERLQIEFIGPIPLDKRKKDSRLKYHGLIKKENELKAILDQADVLICPSLAEGMPTVILEAMSRGLAVIATNVGAVQIEVDKQTGWMVEAGNVDELLRVVKESLEISDKDLLQMKEAARTKVKEKFLWDKVVDKTIEHMKASIS